VDKLKCTYGTTGLTWLNTHDKKGGGTWNFFCHLDDLTESVVAGQKGIATGLNFPATIDWNEAIFCPGLEVTWQLWPVGINKKYTVKYAPFTNNWWLLWQTWKCCKARNYSTTTNMNSGDFKGNDDKQLSMQCCTWKWTEELFFFHLF